MVIKTTALAGVQIECVSGSAESGYEWRHPLEIAIINRLASLSPLRELQVNSWTDIVTLRKRLHPTKEMEHKIRGALQRLQKVGGITGKAQGTDGGYPYKRWSVADKPKMVEASKQQHLPLMSQVGKQRITKAA